MQVKKKGEEERGANKISEWVATINVWQHFISYNALQSGNVGFQHWNLLFAAVFVEPSQCVLFKRRQSAKPRQVFFFFFHVRDSTIGVFFNVGFVLQLKRNEQSSAEFPLRLVGAGARTETITN